MSNKYVDFITDDNKLEGSKLRLASLVFLSIAGLMCFGEYVKINNWWFDHTLTFKPGFIAAIIAIFLVSPLYLRGILKWSGGTYSIISGILILLVFASFVQLALGGNGLKNQMIMGGMIISILLTWLGMRAISGISWIMVIGLAVYSMIINDSAMGFYGFIYIGSAFFGLVLHSELNPGVLFKEVKSEFKGMINPVIDNAQESMAATGEMIDQKLNRF